MKRNAPCWRVIAMRELSSYFASPVAYIVMLGTACMGFWTAVRAGGGGR